MLSFKKYVISESLTLYNKTLRYGKGKNNALLKMKLGDFDAHSLFSMKEFSTAELKELKSGKSEEYAKFIKSAAIYCSIYIRKKGITLITTPESTSSNILNDFIRELKAITGDSVDFVPNKFLKVVPSKILLRREDIPEKIKDRVEREYARVIKMDKFELKKIDKISLSYFYNMFEFDGKFTRHTKSDSKILVLDDILSSGTTLKSIMELLSELGYSSVEALTIMKK